MLQLASRQRCAIVVARVAATLRRCCSTRRGNATAGRVVATGRVTATLRSSHRCGTVAAGTTLARLAATTGRAAPKFLFFSLLDSFKERTKARQREKRQGFETCFPALLVGLNVTQKLLFTVTVVAIEINCKEVVKVYVDGGRAVTTVSI